MIEVLNSYLCHDCGSDHAISEVVYGKIKINMCKECIDKKEEQTEFKFSESSDKAKAYALLSMYEKVNIRQVIPFDGCWNLLSKEDLNPWRFNQWGEIIEEEENE